MITLRHCVLAAFLFHLFSGDVLADCRQISENARQAMARHDTEQLIRLYEQAKYDDGCTDALRGWLGKQIAIAFVDQAKQAFQADDDEQASGFLKQGLGYDRYWMALAMMGDVENMRKHYEQASLYYQESLLQISNREATQTPPPPAVIGRIFKKAEQNRLLSARYVKIPTNRAGELDGVAALSCRGVVFEQVAVPITFQYNSTALTPRGQKAAADLLTMLQQQKARDIALVGHTDSRGSDEHNDSLSFRRADAVRAYLKDHGYTGHITVMGRGKKEPYQLDDPENYSREELYHMNRRVVLKR